MVWKQRKTLFEARKQRRMGGDAEGAVQGHAPPWISDFALRTMEVHPRSFHYKNSEVL